MIISSAKGRNWKLLCLLALGCPFLSIRSDGAVASVNPEADTFLRSGAPTNNYGGAGAISVSGSAAVNGSNEQNGLYDSLLRFSTSNLVGSIDSNLGTHDWLVWRATLRLTEVGAPVSPIFNRGVGAFEIRWLAGNQWIEGTGLPLGPTTDGVTWNDLPSLLNPTKDLSLGQYTNSGADGTLYFDLGLKEPFLSAMRSGEAVTFYLTAVNPQIGFTAGSRTFFVSTNLPELEIEAYAHPHPQFDSIGLAGTNVSVSFATASNWTYVLQFKDGMPASSVAWSNSMSFPSQPTNSHVTFSEGMVGQRFYRLAVTR